MITKIAHKIVRFLIRLFFIFPIKKNKIILNCQKGRMYACNPRAIFEYLYVKHPNQYQFIWVLNNKSNDLKEFTNNDDAVKTVRYNTFQYFLHHLTSKIIIANIHSPIYLPLRKQQIMIDTWHGGGAYKRVGLQSPKQISLSKSQQESIIKTMENKDNQAWERYKSKYNAKDTTYFISSSKIFTQVMYESQLLSLDRYVEIGMPRNDVFFTENAHLKDKAKKILGIKNETKVLFFAPTYRGNVKTQEFDFTLDVELILNAVQKQWGGDWIFVFRGHILGKAKIQEENYSVDASQYEEMQELLVMADVFITDYSSSMWDFALTKKPAFLFTPDLEYYKNGDRGFYTPIKKWPFPYAKNNEELQELILSFDVNLHNKKVNKHLHELGSFETGNAIIETVKLIENHISLL